MKNSVISYTPENNSLGSYRKEKAGLYRQYTVIDLDSAHYLTDGTPQHSTPIIIRVYWPAQTAYACAWISTRDNYSIGKGKAGGHGYCKESAAIDCALRDAGVQLEHSIHGVGQSAIKDAIAATARFIGLTNWTLTIAHA
jgi:hypothetical protein